VSHTRVSMVTRYNKLVCAWGHKTGVAWSHTTWLPLRWRTFCV